MGIQVPGPLVQVDVKYPKTPIGRLYRFKVTRYRVAQDLRPQLTRWAIHFVDEVRRAFPVAIRRIQTDNASVRGTDFRWHLRDLEMGHKPIPIVPKASKELVFIGQMAALGSTGA